MAITISGTDGIVGAGFTVDASGVSVTAGVGTFSSLQGSGANLTALPAANLTGTLPAISGANLTGITAGITMADQWRITTTFQVTSQAYITSNWERNDSTGYGGIGAAMSESSGVFSFPSTGIYLIRININWYADGGGVNYNRISISTTVDNSGYSSKAYSYQGVANSAQNGFMSAETLFDVTDVSTHKVKFEALGSNTRPYISGDTDRNLSYATFIKLGDT